ncbi:hypothetical protein GCM10009425_28670 [Pseudomonas asuensis]|uniref:Lipoprotein n=1 Tax=Pseudomonas asuensis TaxID=1825787 RepID=A0ABQ2GX90_9PSED|nr:hypothetical protein [Pseudomonas asuensis]GGM16071.1 hypothetical protein GCM10009425_28670 [Pseudomonas asuensis]
MTYRLITGFMLTAAFALSGCQSRPLTPVEVSLQERAIPLDQSGRQSECRSLAELYSSCYVALATWTYAKTDQKATREEFEGAMHGAKARALQLNCPSFWEAE